MLTYDELNKMRDDQYELGQFLGGYFHQDAESVESALKEYLKDAAPEFVKVTINSIDDFITSKKYTNTIKAEFIEKNVSFILPQSPLDWLESVKKQLEKYIES